MMMDFDDDEDDDEEEEDKDDDGDGDDVMKYLWPQQLSPKLRENAFSPF